MTAPVIPPTMKALLQHEKEGIHNFRLTQVDTPKPNPHQVLIQVHAAALNPIDIKRGLIVEDQYPIIAGYEVAGVVVAVGNSVTNLSVGDRVFGDIMRESAGEKFSGSLAQFCLSPSDILAVIPTQLTFEQAAALPVAALTAMQAMETMHAKPGHNVFISGGAGGVGIHAIQIAKNVYGAGHVATTASAAKFDFVKKYGADIVVNYRQEDVGEKLKAWADVVMDCVGDVEAGEKIIKEGAQIISVQAFGPRFMMLQPTAQLMASLVSAVADGKLSAVLDSVHPFSKVHDALERIASGRAMGKVVVNVVE
ncbi:unnamed protein product [Agarophyton chilense]|eukprot:gb/GEZJ01002301.1/.p1 GENE.gb/GEZJ01002301.1/~~gb/GEZJ01002301.1/.p1  ORF type:complete len:309 (-),score=65.33 gb/GEZJ01002301.1/:2929-3855(-)